MHEIIQEILTYLRSMWRYRWYAMGLAWVFAISGWVLVAKMPDQYTASAKVNIDSESVLRPLMRGLTIEPDINQRLTLITRTLLSRPNMEKLAHMTDLDIKATTPAQLEGLYNRLASTIVIGSVDRVANIYTLTYTSTNPNQAKDVIQNLLAILSESTLGESREGANMAQHFLQQQIEHYESKLTVAENKLRDFKRENHALMPTLSAGYYESLQKTEAMLEESQLQLQEATRSRDELKRQLIGEEPIFGIAADYSAVPDSEIEVRIKQLEKQRDELLLQYTAEHPQVISIEETIISLRERKLTEEAGHNTKRQNSNSMKENPIYQQIRIALAQDEARVSSLSVRVREYESKVKELREMIHRIPEVENELKRLEREFDLAQTKYNEFIERHETAVLSEEVEQAGEGVQIKIIDPPHVPARPTGPNRLLFYTVSLVFAIGAGVALAFVMSQIKPVVHDIRTLRRLTELPVYGSVSRMWTPELLRKKKIEYGGFAVVGVLMIGTYASLLKNFA